MTISIVPLVVMAALYACGVFLLLERSLTRVLLGVLLVGNATNLLILITAGGAGTAPIMSPGVSEDEIADPLPQALILTAIVITFAVSAFLLALIYRSWKLADEDDIEIDEEDIAIGTRESGVEEPDLEELASASDFAPVDEAEESALGETRRDA